MAIKLEHVNYIYGADTELAVAALKDVCISIEDGQFIGLIGHTGSGKSTLVQHLNGLLKATDGAIYYNGKNIYDKDYNMKELRSKVGLVFQYPEHQLLKSMFLPMYASDRRTWGFPGKRRKAGPGKRWSLWGSVRNIISSHPLTCPAGRKEEWPLRACLP